MTKVDIIDKRCAWCASDSQYIDYHDNEWGRLVFDDNTLFEYLILEGAQAGLSWLTILHRRTAYRFAFCNFDPRVVARMTDADVDRLMLFDGMGVFIGFFLKPSKINGLRQFKINTYLTNMYCNYQ